jgi:WD40 repeat protein
VSSRSGRTFLQHIRLLKLSPRVLFLVLDVARHSHRAVVNSTRWSPDGNLVATAGGEGLIRLFDIRTFKELEPLKGHKEPITGKSQVSEMESGNNVLTFSNMVAFSSGLASDTQLPPHEWELRRLYLPLEPRLL